MPHRIENSFSNLNSGPRVVCSEPMTRPATMHRVVAEVMTIRETSFFRDHLPWEMLAKHLLSEIIAKRKDERKLRIWSAGCATGQEAYSLAMTICDRFPELAEWDVQILGTDLSQSACVYARRGKYSRLEINRGLPARMMLRYFLRGGDEWSVRPNVQQLVRFEQEDLRQPTSEHSREFDLVLLRNVLPYFDEEERAAVIAGVHARMRDEAAILVGMAGQIDDAPGLFRQEIAMGQQFYRAVTTP